MYSTGAYDDVMENRVISLTPLKEIELNKTHHCKRWWRLLTTFLLYIGNLSKHEKFG